MAKKEFKVRTKRLVLKPMTETGMERLVAEAAEEDKKAYAEMLENSKAAEDPFWYCAWGIYEKKTGKLVGDLCFKGPEQYASVEIGYGIYSEYRGNGYAEEAVRAMMDLVLYGDHGIYYIDAETAPENKCSQHILEKLGFIATGEVGKEGPLYVYKKPQHSLISIGICFGMCFGVSFGAALKRYGLGMPLGIAIGMAFGVLFDSMDKKKRAEADAKRAMKNSADEE